jgi:hypothetical protein
MAINQIKVVSLSRRSMMRTGIICKARSKRRRSTRTGAVAKRKIESPAGAIGRLTLIERECLNLRTKVFRYREIGEILEIGTMTVCDTLSASDRKAGKRN